MRKNLLWLLPALLSLLVPCLAKAGPGDLDPSFGGTGKVMTVLPLGSRSAGFGGIHLTSAGQGRFVVATGNVVFEFLQNGARNRRFGDGGAIRIDLPKETDLTGLAVDSRGRILIAGTAPTLGSNPSGDFPRAALVMRYLPDGRPDSGFGDSGRVVTDFGFPAPTVPPPVEVAGAPPPPASFGLPSVGVSGLTVDNADRPVLTGSWVSALEQCYMLIWDSRAVAYAARLRVDGSLDPGFGEGGTIPDLGGEAALPPVIDGARILSGSTAPGCRPVGYTPPTLIRLEEGGTLDQSFGSSGRRKVLLAGSPQIARDRLGRIVLLGYAQGGDGLFRLQRITPRGTTDKNFGGGKGFRLTLGVGPDLAVDHDGRPILATQAGSPKKGWSFVLMRRRVDGRPDHGFGNQGWVKTSFSGSAFPMAILVDDQGRILVAGSGTRGDADVIALARYLSG